MDDSFNEAPVGLQQDHRCSITSFAGLVSWGDVDDFSRSCCNFTYKLITAIGNALVAL